MASKQPTSEARQKQLVQLAANRAKARENAREMKRQQRLLVRVGKALDEDRKKAIIAAANDRVVSMTGISLEFFEDVMTGAIRQTRVRNGVEVKGLRLTDGELADLQKNTSREVLDRGGVIKKSGVDVTGATMQPLTITIVRKGASE